MIPIAKISQDKIKTTVDQLNQHLLLEHMDFQSNSTTTRKTYSFGYNYFTLREDDNAFKPIPDCLQQLCKSSIDAFPKEFNLGNHQDYLNVIVSFYDSGYQLEPHVDVDFSHRFTDGKPVNFYFGEHVIGVILQADETGRFYILKSDNEHEVFQASKLMELSEDSGTTYLLTGNYRRKPYYHGVSKVTHSRVSVTFRTVKFC